MKKITILLSAIMFITTISNAQFLKDISLEELARIDNENDVDLDELYDEEDLENLQNDVDDEEEEGAPNVGVT